MFSLVLCRSSMYRCRGRHNLPFKMHEPMPTLQKHLLRLTILALNFFETWSGTNFATIWIRLVTSAEAPPICPRSRCHATVPRDLGSSFQPGEAGPKAFPWAAPATATTSTANNMQRQDKSSTNKSPTRSGCIIPVSKYCTYHPERKISGPKFCKQDATWQIPTPTFGT